MISNKILGDEKLIIKDQYYLIWRFAVILICCQQTAKIIDLLSANRQQTAKNIPYEKVDFIEKIL